MPSGETHFSESLVDRPPLGYSVAMGLEQWDATRKRYILYRTEEQHSADCARYPFESIPRRVFLDTSVVNVLVKQAEYIFEQEPIPTTIEPTLALDTEALMHIFYVGARAGWDILGSSKTLEEISRTRDQSLRGDLIDYALGLVDSDPNNEGRAFAADLGRRLVDAPFLAALPDPADRELIGNAVGFGCDVFCTCDRATIIRKRGQVRQIPLQILTPAEWWAHIKPWAGLWG